MILLMIGMPTRLPGEPSSYATTEIPWYSNLKKLDYPGVFALLGASVLLTAPLQLTAEGAFFSSPAIVTLLVLSSVFAVGFLIWQYFASQRSKNIVAEPILSWDLLGNRVFLGVLM
jgi:hypothetical protein